MARFILARTATIPAGTAIASPVVVDVSFPEYIVELIQIIIPPGPNGLVGFRLANAGTQVIPYGSDDWIIGNNENIVWALSNQVTSGSWQVFGYNLGDFDHTLYLRFAVTEVSAATSTAGVIPDVVQLVSGGAATAPLPTPPADLGGGGQPGPSVNPPPTGPFVGGPPPAPPANFAPVPVP